MIRVESFEVKDQIPLIYNDIYRINKKHMHTRKNDKLHTWNKRCKKTRNGPSSHSRYLGSFKEIMCLR